MSGMWMFCTASDSYGGSWWSTHKLSIKAMLDVPKPAEICIRWTLSCWLFPFSTNLPCFKSNSQLFLKRLSVKGVLENVVCYNFKCDVIAFKKRHNRKHSVLQHTEDVIEYDPHMLFHWPAGAHAAICPPPLSSFMMWLNYKWSEVPVEAGKIINTTQALTFVVVLPVVFHNRVVIRVGRGWRR